MQAETVKFIYIYPSWRIFVKVLGILDTEFVSDFGPIIKPGETKHLYLNFIGGVWQNRIDFYF